MLLVFLHFGGFGAFSLFFLNSGGQNLPRVLFWSIFGHPPKTSQNHPKIIPKSFPKHPKNILKTSQIIPKSSQNHPKIISKSYKNLVYTLYIPCIYPVYTMNILCIYPVHTLCTPCIYIPCNGVSE